MNISEINVHETLLQQQSAEASHVARLLSLYKSELPYFWSGEEVEILAGYLKHSDGIARNCMVNYPCSVRILCRQ